jgi:hypothetical protein
MSEEMSELDHLIEIGAIEIVGVDESGEFILGITELAKEVAPDLWEAHVAHVDETLLELYDKGLMQVDYDENLEASFSLSEEGMRVAREHGLLPMDISLEDYPDD